MQKYFSGLNPALPPYFFILQVPPWNDLSGLGKNSFDFKKINRYFS
jgi:hypothetical protein